MATVLVVEDQGPVRYALRVLLQAHDLTAEGLSSPAEAEAAVRRGGIALVLQDMNFRRGATSGDEGVALFHRLRTLDPELPIILLTAWASLEIAVQLIKDGAADYVAKPWNDERLLATVKAHLGVRAQRSAHRRELGGAVERSLPAGADICGLVFHSDVMFQLVSLALQVAPEGIAVLLLGPNGAGKEKIAEIIQRNSHRRDRPFVRVDAGGLPDTLLEAELFGAEPGAFTGAAKARIGRFEAADGGTLLLDEVGNLSMNGQMKLLRILQRGEFERLGSTQTRRVDVRLISATNLDVYAAVQSGAFREDLLYRLNVVELRVPPLAERREDVGPIARALLARHAAERDAPPCTLGADALAALEAHSWPGNVRELENCIRRAVLFTRDDVIRADHLQLGAADAARSREPRQPAREPAREPTADEIVAALRKHDGTVRAVAAEFGLSRQTLYRRLERLGIALDSFRRRGERGGDQS